jgi:DNA polymerase III delta subunit
VPRLPFSEKAVPAFDAAPAAILVTGDVDFFVEEAAERAREALGGGDAEVLRFEDDAPVEAISDALLNRSLFSPRRIVELDVSRLLGTEAPGRLLTKALEAWEAGKRREAFKQARALLAALDLPPGNSPEETAEAAAKKVRKKEEAPLLAEILKELPEESSGGPAVLRAALRVLIAREANDGTVALLRAVSPPAGVDLVKEISAHGLVLESSAGADAASALRRLAAARAKEHEVVLEPAAVERLLTRTDGEPAAFAMEIEKLIGWAGKGGRVRAADVEANVEDEASEDVYGLFDAIGRREAGESLARLERLFDGRDVRQGDRAFEKVDEIWPIQFFGMLTSELRRMLLIRARLEEGGGGFDASMPYPAFQARILPRLMAPAAPFGRSPFETGRGPTHPFALFQAARRSSRFTARELARALARAADVDVQLKTSAPALETLTVYVGRLIAGA